MIHPRTAVAGIVAAALLSISACSAGDGSVADELLAFAEEHQEAPVLVPRGIEFGTADIVDASVALVAAARSQTGPTALITSNPTDLRHLLQALDASVHLLAI